MKLKVTRAEVWSALIDDRPGGSAEKLEALARSGTNLEFLLARRALERPGKGVLFAAPIRGATRARAAQEAGFERSYGLHSVRVEGEDAPGLAGRMTRTLASAGISFRGMSSMAIGGRFVCYLALDDEEDVARTLNVLKKLK